MGKIFSGQVALVTGGSLGIGHATAVAFAKRGASVVVADLIEETTAIQGPQTILICSCFTSPLSIKRYAKRRIEYHATKGDKSTLCDDHSIVP